MVCIHEDDHKLAPVMQGVKFTDISNIYLRIFNLQNLWYLNSPFERPRLRLLWLEDLSFQVLSLQTKENFDPQTNTYDNPEKPSD